MVTGTVTGEAVAAETRGNPETIGVATEGTVDMRALGATVERTAVVERADGTVGKTVVVERVDDTTGTIVAIAMIVAAGGDEIPAVNVRRNGSRSRCAPRGASPTLKKEASKESPKNPIPTQNIMQDEDGVVTIPTPVDDDPSPKAEMRLARTGFYW